MLKEGEGDRGRKERILVWSREKNTLDRVGNTSPGKRAEGGGAFLQTL